jgi:glutathione S-transferase
MTWVAGVVLLSLIEYIVFGMLVARARGKYAVAAPAISGNPDFERYFRVQQNTLEQLVVFIPAIWLFGLYVSAPWGAAIGVLFLIGRALYAMGYITAPERRELGFALGMVAQVILVLGALFGIVRPLLTHG